MPVVTETATASQKVPIDGSLQSTHPIVTICSTAEVLLMNSGFN